MKVTINVECTPEEARAFLGLPDVQPMQAAVLAEMEKRVMAEMDRFSADALLNSWLSAVPKSPEQMQDAFTRMFKQGFGTGSDSRKQGGK